MITPLDRLIRRLAQNPLIAGIVLTAVTIVLIGGVVLTMTSAGCGPANALGLKGIANRCSPTLIGRSSPSILPSGPVSGSPSPAHSPPSSPIPTPTPIVPPVVPPVVPPNSGPIPPNSDPSSAGGAPTYPTVADASGSSGPPTPLNCRLPIYVGPPGSGGFIVFPGNTFIADPASSVTTPSPSPGGPSPSPVPGSGYGPGGPSGLSYDHAYSRWLPVPLQAVSADGTLYAFGTVDGIYVVTVSSGAMTELGKGHSWTVLSVSPEGVYATVPNAAGLWVLAYSGASPRQLIASSYWQAVGGGAAYGTPTPTGNPTTITTIQRLDLLTNAVTDFFTRAGMQSWVAGFDAQGVPIIFTTGGLSNEIWIGSVFITAWVRTEYSSSGFNPTGNAVADSHGIWFSGTWTAGDLYGSHQTTPAIVLYIAGSGLYGVSSTEALFAGGCY